jgi:hypothetical protein
MQTPPAVKTKMYGLDEDAPELTLDAAEALKEKLLKLAGVIEAVVLPQEHTVILKVDKSQDWDEIQSQSLVHQLLKG